MATNEDGTATCDRCGVLLSGAGVGTGLLGTSIHPDTGELVDWLFCYVNECRSAVTYDLVNFTGEGVCSCDATPVVRTPSEALVCSDLDPLDPTTIRPLTFCYVGGCADRLLSQIGNL